MASYTITVALYHRDSFSIGRNRQIFGYEAYHWGFLFIPPERSTEDPRDCWSFEATDANDLDTVTWSFNNPTMSWWMRHTDSCDPDRSSKLLGMIVVGQTTTGTSYDEMHQFLDAVPLPVRHQHPQQSCVTWVENAVGLLQRQGWVSNFDMAQFKDFAMAYGDERMKGRLSTQPSLIHYR